MFDVPEEGHTPEQREDIEMVEVHKERYVHDEIYLLIIEPKAQAEMITHKVTIILYKFGVGVPLSWKAPIFESSH